MNLINIFEKIILWSKMILSMRSSKYHLKTNSSLIINLRLIFTPPNSFIQLVDLIWWMISKMMMKILFDLFWNHPNKIKNNSKHRKWSKTNSFDEFLPTSFIFDIHPIWLNFVKNWKIVQLCVIRYVLFIHKFIVWIFSDFNTHFHSK